MKSSRLLLRLAEAARGSIGGSQQLRCYSAAVAASSCGAAEARAGATPSTSSKAAAADNAIENNTIDETNNDSSSSSLPVAYVFLGAPGVGKGTYSTRVADALGAQHVSAGDLVRAEVKAGTELGKQVRFFFFFSSCFCFLRQGFPVSVFQLDSSRMLCVFGLVAESIL